MKIGIVTYHRSHNYGALLQAIALRNVLAQNGNKVSYIDYWPKKHEKMYSVFKWSSLRHAKGVRNKVNYLLNTKYRIKRRNGFVNFMNKYIFPFLSSTDESYDIVIYGSDQIWRMNHLEKPIDSYYFGNNDIVTKKNISYAASMGIIKVTDKEKEIIKNNLSHLDLISVREESLKELINSLGFSCWTHLDPTLLLTEEDWVNLMNLHQTSKDKYILHYKMFFNSFNDEDVKKFAREKGLKTITIYSSAFKKNTKEERTTADPMEFLQLIYGADFVFTSSFHGLVFALLFQKQFYASFEKNSGRAESLLHSVGLIDRLLQPMSPIPIKSPTIDYKKINVLFSEMRQDSLRFLKELS